MIFRRPLLTIAVTLACATAALGQEVVAPTMPTGEAAPPGTLPSAPRLRLPGSTGGTLPAPDAKPGSPGSLLMPDEEPMLVKPEPETKPAPKLSKTAAFAQDVLERIRFRQVHTQALADRAVQAEWDKSLIVRTDAEKRAILKQYYKLLYARMAKIDGTLKKQIDLKALEADHRLTQAHITPTEVGDDSERSTAARVFAD